jgi:hypothetical protein
VKRILAAVTASAVALVFCSTALANALTCGHGSCYVSAGMTPPHQGGGTLPFTGLNLATVTAVAALLVAGGLTLRWATRRRT